MLFLFQSIFIALFCIFHCFKLFLDIVCAVSVDVVHTV